jgi:type I restriction enzyme M protein
MSGPSLDRYAASQKVQLVPAGQIWCYIRDKPINESPEEHIRQRICRSLVEEYGYPKDQLRLNFVIRIGRKKHPVDVTIFGELDAVIQENIRIIVETKREDIKPADRDNGIEQLKSYMAACLNCQFGMWTNGLERIL